MWKKLLILPVLLIVVSWGSTPACADEILDSINEAIEAYNDYRRTGIPTMTNPNNALTGFVWRFPYPTSETSANSANVPTVDIFAEKVWWAGGSEKQ